MTHQPPSGNDARGEGPCTLVALATRGAEITSSHRRGRRTRTGARIAALLALAAAVAAPGGCAAGSSARTARSDQLLSTRGNARCEVESYPAELPAVNAVVDSAALVEGVRALRREDPSMAGHALLSLGFDREGMNSRRDVIEHSLDPVAADSIQQLVFAARREVEQSEQEWGVRLRVEVGDPVVLRVGRREFCPPVARDRLVREAMEGVNPVGIRYRGGARERIVHMRALVGPLGLITTSRIDRGELGGSSLERELDRHLRQFLFNPATVDGVPTGAWVVIPVRIPA